MFNNCYKDKKVLVTGHTGFKGSWLTTWLNMLGANVVGIALEPDTQPAHFNLLNLSSKIESYFVDIRDYEKLRTVLRNTQPEIVLHLAAQPLVRDSYERPLYTFETNVLGTANVLNACREIKALRAIVAVTSDKCYDNKEWVWGYRENDSMGGYDPYSASKGCSELVVACMRNSYFNVAEFGKKHNVLIASGRAGNVIGGGDWAKDRLIPDMVRATAMNEIVTIRSPHATRPWQHVLECLSGYLALGEKLLAGEQRFAEGWNFAPTQEGEAQVLRIVQIMQKYWSQLQYEIKAPDVPLHEANLLKLDCSKANASLKWRNVWSLDKTVEITTNWYREFYANSSMGKRSNIVTYSDIEQYVEDARKLGVKWAEK